MEEDPGASAQNGNRGPYGDGSRSARGFEREQERNDDPAAAGRLGRAQRIELPAVRERVIDFGDGRLTPPS